MTTGFPATPPVLSPVALIEAEIGTPQELGALADGQRRIIPILGGRVSGARLAGRVLPGGADWQTVRPDGLAEIEARYTLALTEVDGAAVDALVDIRNPGMRHGPAEVLARVAAGEDVDPSLYYFRTTPRFTTGHPALGWMNRTLFVARGRRLAARVEIEVFAVG
ncbi:MAG: DUF3237 domain-containing protein [Tistrella sp.]|jgi:hypothetical protein|uniref:UPF0311 protein TMO_3130 n=2 Tax=Tistrella mobilis TaxID=171437 RepID=I3TQD0_TISMK|nr:MULTISPECIES: DUF3237 domain-containing protein [Tistrella]AFK54968.1 hypothetical protein TMO_3130 [Tistrella mobilis KA081020-065]KYO49839.1 hypothetical protein AUP44_15735 [Tistrella mobilis]MAD37038.1 DUF3237 domain-containing protein [Tistrella sp.]MBA75047.1 DUF3237 domain-containing protein [Tistrella sp.]HAE48464.1 DUF3237 domain-containing protein [Tistrella mobilis]